MSDESKADHLFKTSISREKFEAVLARSCKAPYTYDIQAGDPTIKPQVRVYGVTFTTLEDRDRVRIAMRFVEKEQADMARQAPAPTPRPATAPRRAVAAV